MDNMSWLTRKIPNKHHDNMHSRPMYFRPEGFNVKERKKQDLESFVEVFILFIIIKSVKILR